MSLEGSMDVQRLKTELQAIRTQFEFLRFSSNRDEAIERLMGRMLEVLEHMAQAIERKEPQRMNA